MTDSHKKPWTLKVKNINCLSMTLIKTLGWNVDPLIVIVAGARATTFKPSMISLGDNFNISLEQIKKTFTAINTIAIQYAMKILLTKCKPENN